MDTGITLRISGGFVEHPECYNVKVDAFSLPYIILDNKKFILSSAEATQKISQNDGQVEYKLQVIAGKATLQGLIENPKLTCEVLRLKELVRQSEITEPA